MMTASFGSDLSQVRSSASRARHTSSGCTQTRFRPRCAASWSSTRHRCPVGSQATVTESNPAAFALATAQSRTSPSCHALHSTFFLANTFESWSVTTIACFTSARSIPTIALLAGSNARRRASRAFRLRSPRDRPLRSLTDVLLDALGYQARQPHQEDVPAVHHDTQGVTSGRRAGRAWGVAARKELDRRWRYSAQRGCPAGAVGPRGQ